MNHFTHLVELQICNSQQYSDFWLNKARGKTQEQLTQELEDYYFRHTPWTSNGVLSEIIGYALSQVEWDEIADLLLIKIKEGA